MYMYERKNKNAVNFTMDWSKLVIYARIRSQERRVLLVGFRTAYPAIGLCQPLYIWRLLMRGSTKILRPLALSCFTVRVGANIQSN